MSVRRLRDLVAQLPGIRVKLSLRNRRTSRSTISSTQQRPYRPDQRIQGRHLGEKWNQAVLRVFDEAALFGRVIPAGETFSYEIPHKLIPRKYPGLFAMSLNEGGYEVGLVPRASEVRTNGRKRSGTLTVVKL